MPGGPSAVRRVGVYGVTVVFATAGILLTSFAASRSGPVEAPVDLAWWMVLPVYLLALQRPLEYE
ncbi:MAG: hypothetical protein ABR549_10770, partial [Mycobacteriales bacterium]